MDCCLLLVFLVVKKNNLECKAVRSEAAVPKQQFPV
jgi:hypothetical protein